MIRTGMKSLVAATALLFVGTAASAQGVRVEVNGERVYFDGPGAQQVRGRVMIPLRGVLEKMGAYVDWDPATRTVMASRGGTDIRLPLGSRIAYVDGRAVELDVAAMTIAGRTMVPLRFVSENLGANVAWFPEDRTVAISTTGAPVIANRPYRTTPDRAHRTGARVTLPAGTVIPAELDQALSSRSAREGDRFTATVISGPNDAGLPEGTRIEGVVREVIPARGNDPGVLDVDFVRINFPSGQSAAIDGSLISLDNRAVQRSESGYLTAKVDPARERLKWVGIGAGAGLIIGALTRQNTLVSILTGGALGYLYNELGNRRPGDVNLAAGTDFGVRLDRPLTFRERGIAP